MDNAKFWWSSSETPQPPVPPVDVINQSLRFRSAQLEREGTPESTVYTLSFWVKKAVQDTAVTLFQASSRGQAITYNNNNQLFYNQANTSGATTAVYRDPSAWYHVVYNYTADTDTLNLWVNGEQEDQNLSNGANSWGGDIVIGEDGGVQDYYMADVYFIDGQVLLPTAFGRFNDNGVWVPREIDFDGNWGANGFHLTFAQEDWTTTGTVDTTVVTTVADRSGNGNDFTATGFNIVPVGGPPGFFSSGLTVPGGWQGVAPASAAFNGLDRPGANSNTAGAQATWAPNPAVTFERSFEVLASDQNWNYDGGTGTWGGSLEWRTIATGAGEISATTPFVFGNGSSWANMQSVRIDGVVLLEGNGNPDYDLMQDSPTQNWATGNPLLGSRDISLANANLTNGPNQAQGTIGTIMINSGRWYFESVCQTSVDNTRRGIGVANIELANTAALLASGSANVGEWYFYSNGLSDECELGSNGTWITIPDQDPDIVPNEGDVMKLALDMDTGEMWYGMNDDFWLEADGTPRDDFSLDNPTFTGITGPVSFTASTRQEQPFIFGQQNGFLFTPPDGFEALQTQNLPAAPIANGRDHFRAITGPGSGADTGVGLEGPWSENLFAVDPGPDTPPFNTTNTDFWMGGPVTPAVNAFDNNNGTYAGAGGSGAWIVFRPPGGINVTDRIEFDCNFGLSEVWINEQQQTITANQSVFNIPFVGRLENLAIRGTPGSFTASLIRMFVDGERLNDAGILAQAQQAFPTGLWWIKSRVTDGNTNNHQLVDSVRGNGVIQSNSANGEGNSGAYTAPAGDSVAWCWSAPEEWTDNSGTINASGRRNLDAGFSIVSYTGNLSNNQTVAHGLTQAPDMVWYKTRVVNQGWINYFSSLTDTVLRFNTTDQAFDSSIFLSGPPDAQFLNLNAEGNTNDDEPMIAYCWHSVPGYSAFGSYQGNGDPNGVFIWTGMKPAWILIKRVNTADHWAVYDTTRDVNNPAFQILRPDVANGDNTNAVNNLDILSNGFKWRTNDSRYNANEQYVYACFAENPFQAPVPAR